MQGLAGRSDYITLFLETTHRSNSQACWPAGSRNEFFLLFTRRKWNKRSRWKSTGPFLGWLSVLLAWRFRFRLAPPLHVQSQEATGRPLGWGVPTQTRRAAPVHLVLTAVRAAAKLSPRPEPDGWPFLPRSRARTRVLSDQIPNEGLDWRKPSSHA